MTTMVNPTTGLPRLLLGNDQGVWTILDNQGTFETQIGNSDQLAGTDRNGNLQITQFYYGAAQPSSAAAQIAGALFYGSAQDNGGPVSDPFLVGNGNITWSGPGGDAGGVATNPQGDGSAYQYFWGCCGGRNTDFFQYIQPGNSGGANGPYVGRTNGLLQASNGLPTPDPQWPFGGGANFAVNPVNGNDVVISSAVGRIFTTTDAGVHWFDVGDPAVFGTPTTFTVAMAYGAPDPSAPEGVGNLGNFIYVGTVNGQMYVTQDGGGSGANNNWLNISLGLDGSSIQSIVTDPVRGSHDAYAVTSTGVFYIKDSILLANNPTNAADAWVNITSNIHNLAYSLYGQSYNPTTDPNSKTYNQAMGLTSIVADWRYQIPNSPTNPSAGYHPVLYVAGNSGVYQSLDQGQTWSLFPSTTFGAVTPGGYLPHVSVSSLSLSLGNINPNTGMPNTAGPYNPASPGATPDPDLLMAATYGQGEYAINLAPLLFPTSVQVASADTSGTDANGNPIVTTTTPTINGLSEVTGFGNATWVTIVDETPTDTTFGQIIGGFDPSTVVAGKPIPITSSNSTNALGNMAVPISTAFNTNGLKTIEVFTTDNAGAQSNKVTLSFTVQATNIVPPPPSSPPPSPTLELSPAVSLLNGVPVTSSTSPGIAGTTILGTFVTVTETWENAPGGPQTITSTLTGSDINSDGTFSFNFQDFTDTSGNPVNNGIFEVSATATYTQYQSLGASAPANTFTGTLTSGSASVAGVSSTAGLAAGELISGTGVAANASIASVSSSTSSITLSQDATTSGSETLLATVYFQIDNTPPPTVTDFRLNPANDTGIMGDNVTTDRTPLFIGTAPAGDTVELFVTNQSGVQNTTVASATTSHDANGVSYDFAISLTNLLNVGQTTLFVEVIDPAGNISKVSNYVSVAINSTAVDYAPSTTAAPTGGSTSDPALFTRNTTTNQLQWLVQAPTGTAPWFGPSGVLYSSLPGTANVVPFSGDFDGDGLTELAYYNLSTATWTINDSSKYQPFAFTGTLTSGSASVTGVSSTTGLSIGQDVTGTGIPAGTTILTINGLTATITLSANATASGSENLTSTAPPVSFVMGTPNSSVPVMGNFDPNGPAEPAVFTINSQGQGVWTIASALTGTYTVNFGQTGDIPAPGDYDAIGYDEVAVYRPSTGQFLVLNPVTLTTRTISIPGISTSPDLSSLVPVPGQYDNLAYYAAATHGTNQPIFGHTEAAVYDPKTGVFTILGPNGAYSLSGFQPSDIPAVADYLGAGEDQVVAYQPSNGDFIQGTLGSNGQTTLTTLATLGQSGDIPVIAPLSYRLPGSGDPPSGSGSSSTGSTGSTGSSSTGSTGSTGSSSTGSTGSTGSSSTGSTGSTGSSSTGTTGSGGSSSTGSTNSSTSSTTSTSSPAQSGTSSPAPSPVPVSTSKNHKKVVTKKAHPKKTVKVHAKKVSHTVKKVHVAPAAKHKTVTVVRTAAVTSGHASSHIHLVDLALQDVHVNLRRSNTKHHGA